MTNLNWSTMKLISFHKAKTDIRLPKLTIVTSKAAFTKSYCLFPPACYLMSIPN